MKDPGCDGTGSSADAGRGRSARGFASVLTTIPRCVISFRAKESPGRDPGFLDEGGVPMIRRDPHYQFCCAPHDVLCVASVQYPCVASVQRRSAGTVPRRDGRFWILQSPFSTQTHEASTPAVMPCACVGKLGRRVRVCASDTGRMRWRTGIDRARIVPPARGPAGGSRPDRALERAADRSGL